MEPEISLTCSQDPATVPHPEPNESSPRLNTLFLYGKTYLYLTKHHALNAYGEVEI
jgi:hypothetical protein